jgi:hypothetical protein
VALQTATVLQNVYGLEGNIAAEFLGVKVVIHFKMPNNHMYLNTENV